jgi:hypothetical protein
MTDKQRSFCVREMPRFADRDAYISELALSSIWGNDAEADIPPERLETLGKLWDACHRSVREVAAAAGLSQAGLADHFCIPLRTVQNWCSGINQCPTYTLLMMQEMLGLLQISP